MRSGYGGTGVRDRRDPGLTTEARECLTRCFGEIPGRCLLVYVDKQRLLLLVDGATVTGYPVSTARAGVNAKEGSRGTPPGVHRIAQKIGAGMAPGTVFKARVSTGQIWASSGTEEKEKDLILSRILTLEGLEEGINRGKGLDTLARHIYIHGTNHEGQIGTAVSGGCVRMTNADVIDLFDRVEAGDPVVVI
jgi:lipoprotein-anchoring transpeptidase ErfK/SrfK